MYCQEQSTHKGMIRVVNKTNSKLMPSTPTLQLTLSQGIQAAYSTNWNSEVAVLNFQYSGSEKAAAAKLKVSVHQRKARSLRRQAATPAATSGLKMSTLSTGRVA